MVKLARLLAVLTIIAAIIGVWRHFDENYITTSLDGRYTERWEAMSTGARLWEVLNGSVGHVPVPAQGVLVPKGVTLGMATIGLGTPSNGSPGKSTIREVS